MPHLLPERSEGSSQAHVRKKENNKVRREKRERKPKVGASSEVGRRQGKGRHRLSAPLLTMGASDWNLALPAASQYICQTFLRPSGV